MKSEIPKISTKKPAKINIDSIIKKDLNGSVSEVNEEYKAIRRTVDARVTKSVSFSQHELDIINAFIKEQPNVSSLAEFVRMVLYRDGAFSDAYLAASSIQKRTDLSFMDIEPKDFSFNYKQKFENFDDELQQGFKYNSSVKKPKSFFVLEVMERRIQEYLNKKGFPSFSAFVKVALVEYGIYSKALATVVLDSLHTTKSQAKSKKMKSSERKPSAKPLSAALHPQAHLLYTKYNDISKELYGGITLALVIKFIMIKKGIIADTLLEKNSPRNPEKKMLVDSFLDNLSNSRILLNLTADEKKTLKDKDGLRKNITVSFSAENFYELKNYIAKEGMTFPEILIEWLHLEDVFYKK